MIKHITECTRLVVVCASVKWAATHVCCVCGCYTDDTPMVPDDSGCVHHIWMTKQPTSLPGIRCSMATPHRPWR